VISAGGTDDVDEATRTAQGEDNTVRVWDAVIGSELNRLKGHTRNVTSVACAPDGRLILSGAADFTLRLWRI
jgi:WD40 repeat protein